MKILVFGFLLTCIIISCKADIFTSLSLSNLKSGRAIGDDLQKFLEEFRKRMCHEIPRKGIPKLDPFEIDNFDFELHQGPADLNINVNQLSVSQLAKYRFDKLSVSLTFKFGIDVVLPKIKIKSNFKANGTIKNLFEINGDGDFSLDIDNIRLIFDGALIYNDGHFLLNITKFEPSIETITFNINNLFPDKDLDEFVSDLITDIGLSELRILWEEWKEFAISLITDLVNEELQTITKDDLLAMIKNADGFFDEKDPPGDCTYDDKY